MFAGQKGQIVDIKVTNEDISPGKEFRRLGQLGKSSLWAREGGGNPITAVKLLQTEVDAGEEFTKIDHDLNAKRLWFSRKVGTSPVVDIKILEVEERALTGHPALWPWKLLWQFTADGRESLLMDTSNPRAHLCVDTKENGAKIANAEYEAGDYLDVRDTSHNWVQAHVVKVNEVGQCLLHYEGWSHKWDEWKPRKSPDIAPLFSKTWGWTGAYRDVEVLAWKILRTLLGMIEKTQQLQQLQDFRGYNIEELQQMAAVNYTTTYQQYASLFDVFANCLRDTHYPQLCPVECFPKVYLPPLLSSSLPLTPDLDRIIGDYYHQPQSLHHAINNPDRGDLATVIDRFVARFRAYVVLSLEMRKSLVLGLDVLLSNPAVDLKGAAFNRERVCAEVHLSSEASLLDQLLRVLRCAGWASSSSSSFSSSTCSRVLELIKEIQSW